MALKTMRIMGIDGDKIMAKWDTETVSSDLLAQIEAEFKEKIAEGYFAVDITDKRNKFINKFNSNADILLMPSVKGGRS